MQNRYPVGNDDFASLRRDGYLYVDKTETIWQMIGMSQWTFLSRPRRFGKTLLTSTLKAYFEGRRELFDGLWIAAEEEKKPAEEQWLKYPVLYFNMAPLKNLYPDEMRPRLSLMLDDYENIYGRNAAATTPGARLTELIKAAYRQTGKGVVLLFDEYDSPLLNSLANPEQLKDIRQILQEFYGPIKDCSAYERYTFITGITKFSQLSIFSTLNNLNNISMLPQFAGICGFTETELKTTLKHDVECLADDFGITYDEMHQRLKMRYDGYHFSSSSEDVYNPFSLLKAFANRHLGNYWFESGTPTFIFNALQKFNTDITTLSEMQASASAFDTPTEAMTTALPLLYQTGYLTIKSYDAEMDIYTLGLPNQEVRVGFSENMIQPYLGIADIDYVKLGFAAKFWTALKNDDIEQALHELKAYMAGLPYVEGFKQKLNDVTAAEGFYEWTFYLIFSMLNVYVETQVKCINGRIDVVVHTPHTIYVMELKTNGTPLSAIKQIDSRGYGLRYSAEGKHVVKVGIRFDTQKRTLRDWKIVSCD